MQKLSQHVGYEVSAPDIGDGDVGDKADAKGKSDNDGGDISKSVVPMSVEQMNSNNIKLKLLASRLVYMSPLKAMKKLCCTRSQT